MPRLLIAVVSTALFAASARADAPADVLDLVPADFALCLRLHDLRGQHERLVKSSWFAQVASSAIGRVVLDSPDARKLLRFEKELQKVLEVDWASIRDDILGDEVVLAYRPAAPGKHEEEGVVLLRARQPALLTRLVSRLNDIQQNNGELRSLEKVTYKDRAYYRRNDRGKELFYLLDGALLAVAGKETSLQAIVDCWQRLPGQPSPWRQRFRQVAAEKSFITLGVNPQLLDLGPTSEGPIPAFWKALETIFVIVQPADALEVRLNLQFQAEHLPSWLRAALTEPASTSKLWQQFPADAVAVLAGRVNFGEALATVTEMTPPAKRTHLAEAAQRSVGAISGLDFFKDILPNVGPDWGICVLPPSQPEHWPQLLAALAVQPGARPVAVDQALLRALQLVAGLVVLDYNKHHPDAMRQQTTLQDKLEVRYLESEKFFPPGLQPAYALKEGYLLLATSPDAIRRFAASTTSAPDGDTPLLRIAAKGLASLVRQRREQIIAKLTRNQNLTTAEAQNHLTKVAEFLDLFDRLELSRRTASSQAQWVLRIYPAERE